MYLQELQYNWNTFGEEDPLWAVLSSPEKKYNKWDKNDFFSTGTRYIDGLIKWMDTNGYPKRRYAALDFGCGVGRLTQALCNHFDLCVGVDIAPSMIKSAKEFNRHGKNCIYKLNETSDLQAFPSQSFDLVNTAHVLQHIHPRFALPYIAEFIRVLRPGGLAVFHCPSAPATYAYPPEGITCSLETDVESLIMEQGDVASVPVRVTNLSRHPVGSSSTINAPAKFIHHWVCLTSGQLHKDHGYINLPIMVLEPEESFEFEYKAASPPASGQYALLINVADYTNTNISETKDEMIAISTQVTPREEKEDQNSKTLAEKRPRSESHIIPVEQVTNIVKRMGGRMVEIESTQVRPGAITSSVYYATF